MLIITSKTAKYKMLCVMVIQSTSRNLLCCVRNLPDGLPCNYVCRDKKLTSGIVHSIDIHPSRKHTCLVRCLYFTCHI